MAVPRKVRIFRDAKKSPNWYVEWRDLEGRRHCESCGPDRQEAEKRAGEITAELRLKRDEARRRARITTPNDAGHHATANDCPGLQLQGLLRCAHVEVPITIRLEVPAKLFAAICRALDMTDPA